MKKIIFDIGANQGQESMRMVNDDSIVYAFEPTRYLISDHLWPKTKENPNIIVIPMAVDIQNGFKTFNVAGYHDWGCSSLHENIDNIDPSWQKHFEITDSYLVPTITLYDFCILYGIEKIDYLSIDTQGNDLNILKSLRNKIDIVVEGICEASNKQALYKSDYSLNSTLNFLYSNNFEVTSIEPNDLKNLEVNVYFRKKLI